jgi:hypothetical protein
MPPARWQMRLRDKSASSISTRRSSILGVGALTLTTAVARRNADTAHVD